MAINKIQFKRSKTSGYVPKAGTVAEGELFINLPDKTVFTADDKGAIISVGGGGGGSGSGLPVGAITAFPTRTVPTGFLLCDGSSFNQLDYPDLYAVLGTNILPDLNGKYLKGVGEGISPLTTVPWVIPEHTHEGSGTTSSFDYGTKTSSSVTLNKNFGSDATGGHTHDLMGTGSDGYTGYGADKFYTVSNAGGWQYVNYMNRRMSTEGHHAHTVNVNFGSHNHSVAIGSHSHNLTLITTGIRESYVNKGNTLDVDHVTVVYAIKAAGYVTNEGLAAVEGMKDTLKEFGKQQQAFTVSMVGSEQHFPPMEDGKNPGPMWVPKDGSIQVRASYPALWAWAQQSNLVVTEDEWQKIKEEALGGIINVYSSGDGSTTFRVPESPEYKPYVGRLWIYSGNDLTLPPLPTPDYMVQINKNKEDIANHETRIDKLEAGGSGGSGSGVPAYQVITKDDTFAETGKGYAIDVSGGSKSIKLPLNPVAGNVVYIKDYNGNCSKSNPIVIETLDKIHGKNESLVLVNPNVSIVLSYVDSEQGWQVVDGVGESGCWLTTPTKPYFSGQVTDPLFTGADQTFNTESRPLTVVNKQKPIINGFELKDGALIVPEDGYYRIRFSVLTRVSNGAIYLRPCDPALSEIAGWNGQGHVVNGGASTAQMVDTPVEEVVKLEKGMALRPFLNIYSNGIRASFWAGQHTSYTVEKVDNPVLEVGAGKSGGGSGSGVISDQLFSGSSGINVAANLARSASEYDELEISVYAEDGNGMTHVFTARSSILDWKIGSRLHIHQDLISTDPNSIRSNLWADRTDSTVTLIGGTNPNVLKNPRITSIKGVKYIGGGSGGTPNVPTKMDNLFNGVFNITSTATDVALTGSIDDYDLIMTEVQLFEGNDPIMFDSRTFTPASMRDAYHMLGQTWMANNSARAYIHPLKEIPNFDGTKLRVRCDGGMRSVNLRNVWGIKFGKAGSGGGSGGLYEKIFSGSASSGTPTATLKPITDFDSILVEFSANWAGTYRHSFTTVIDSNSALNTKTIISNRNVNDAPQFIEAWISFKASNSFVGDYNASGSATGVTGKWESPAITNIWGIKHGSGGSGGSGEDTGWIKNTAFLNGWQQFAPTSDAWAVKYRKKNGVVYLSGLVTVGTNPAVMTLPEGFRPTEGKAFMFSTMNAGAEGGVSPQTRVDVNPDGSVSVVNYARLSANSWVSLDLSFAV